MNFNAYVPKDLGLQLEKVTKDLPCSRNSIIPQALHEGIDKRHVSQWPKDFFSFEPIKNAPDFKALRKDLLDTVKEDPFTCWHSGS